MNLSQITHCSVRKVPVTQPMALKGLNISLCTVSSTVQTNPFLIFRVKGGSVDLLSGLSLLPPSSSVFGCWEGKPGCILQGLGQPVTSPL